MASQIPHNLLHPPRGGSLRDLLAWLGQWRAVPFLSPSLSGVEAQLKVARRERLVKEVDTLVGRAVGLSAWGERYTGLHGAGVARMSVAILSERVFLHLAAHRLAEDHPHLAVTGFGRNHILLHLEGKEVSLGLGKGELRAGLSGDRVHLVLPLPKQFSLSPWDLTDQEWYAVHRHVLPHPATPLRSEYWTRTLMDALLAIRAGKASQVREVGGKPLLYAAYWFGRKPLPWSLIAKRLGSKGGLLYRGKTIHPHEEAQDAGLDP